MDQGWHIALIPRHTNRCRPGCPDWSQTPGPAPSYSWPRTQPGLRGAHREVRVQSPVQSGPHSSRPVAQTLPLGTLSPSPGLRPSAGPALSGQGVLYLAGALVVAWFDLGRKRDPAGLHSPSFTKYVSFWVISGDMSLPST